MVDCSAGTPCLQAAKQGQPGNHPHTAAHIGSGSIEQYGHTHQLLAAVLSPTPWPWPRSCCTASMDHVYCRSPGPYSASGCSTVRYTDQPIELANLSKAHRPK